ncbi:BlaI/MecI/CopY family transcriptional regulator [Streptomyces sp. JNUCC 64]
MPDGPRRDGTGPRSRRRAQGELEALVLAALRSAPGPVNAGWVRDRLEQDLAYTTVITILTRLHTKGAASRERAGRSFVWTSGADEADLAALRMRRVLDAEADRGAVLARFVTSLEEDDEQTLRALLAQEED